MSYTQHSTKNQQKKYITKNPKKQHIIKNYQQNKDIICQECGLVFRRSEAINKHKTKHMDVARYECQECGMIMEIKNNVEKHIEINHRANYRGRGRKNSLENSFSIFLTNLRGLRSKHQSLKKILKKVKPQLVLMNETQLRGNMKVNIEGYCCWTKNRTEQGGGGVATAAAGQIKDTCLGAGEGKYDDEYLITRIEKFQPALSVINCYGEQRKTTKELMEEKWKRLVQEMNAIRARNEFCLLAGDLNKLV